MSAVVTNEKTEQKGESFSTALATRVEDIAPLLPKHVSKERFIAAAHAAVKQNPELLECTVRSLFNALTKAAQDGLMPDGREGVITFYKSKVEQNGKEIWAKVAAWNPMAYGLRKRAREIDGIIIDAQVVCDNDHFVWHQGDDPRIEHEPAKLGTDRGPMIGVYAIFRRENGHILHREIMDRAQVMATKEQSKAKTSLMWTTFETEGWRKAVVRRGMKTVPVSEDLERIITRDDENFDFGRAGQTSDIIPALTPPPAPPPAPPAADPAPLTGQEERALDRAAERQAQTGQVDQMADWIEERIAESVVAGSVAILDEIDDEVCRELDTAAREDLRTRWNTAYGARKTILTKGKK